mgnify:CR=1 FL=1
MTGDGWMWRKGLQVAGLALGALRQAWLVHQSAYDEMCGGPEKTDNTLKVPLWV